MSRDLRRRPLASGNRRVVAALAKPSFEAPDPRARQTLGKGRIIDARAGHCERMQRTCERGFTLIELMIVVAIIAILAGILIPNFVNARAQAQTSACESNLRAIATALELVYADQQSYEPNGQSTFNADPADFTNAAGTTYLNNTPKDAAAVDQTQYYTVKVTPRAAGRRLHTLSPALACTSVRRLRSCRRPDRPTAPCAASVRPRRRSPTSGTGCRPNDRPVATVIARSRAGRVPFRCFCWPPHEFRAVRRARYIAVAALLGKRRRMLTIATFVGGILVAYAVLGFGAGMLSVLTGHASVLYLGLATILAVSSTRTLLQTSDRAHCHEPARFQPRRLSGTFSLGAASALVVSPCCTPIVAAVLGMTAVDANPLSRVALLTAFALGHAAPLFAAGSSARCSHVACKSGTRVRPPRWFRVR